ncbi:MAG: trypsin-like peptidase domain-containing protein [Rhodospirillales bacterium]|nr:trypsin-like peptidase domain-containing protein [Rhodospirillales bacterium]
MRLVNPELSAFLQAGYDAFDPGALSGVVLERFGLQYTNLTTDKVDFKEQFRNVHRYFHHRNMVEQLVVALRDTRPADPVFAAVADSLGFAHLPAQGLEVLVRPVGTPYQDVAAFRGHLSAIEAAVCQVQTPNALGTGVLISASHVLTNHHVVASVLRADGSLSGTVTCRFDHKTNEKGFKTPSVDVKAVSVAASSPHAPEDQVAGGINTALDRLDYAILKLPRAVGTEAIVAGGEPRGFAPPDSRPEALGGQEGLVILQHPGGKAMKIDIGAITKLDPTRIRHSVNTEPGSSGAPVFDAGLNLVALHHAGHSDWPAANLGYNQAIPLRLIRDDLHTKNVVL